MRDVAAALVEMRVASEERAESRKSFRDTLQQTIRQLVEPLRVGDEVTLVVQPPDEPWETAYVYRVDEVTWAVSPTKKWTDAIFAPITTKVLIRSIKGSGDWVAISDQRFPWETKDGSVPLHYVVGGRVYTMAGLDLFATKPADVPKSGSYAFLSQDLAVAFASTHLLTVVELFADLVTEDAARYRAATEAMNTVLTAGDD